MRLLPLESFAHVFEPLRGKHIGFMPSRGNVGDRLIDAATRQLFRHFGISWQRAELGRLEEFDELVFGGGGNMGSLYPGNSKLRERLLDSGRPLTILPQSFFDVEDRPYKTVFVRERASMRLCPRGVLAPDLALGFDPAKMPARPRFRLGLFLRRDKESYSSMRWARCDPIKLCATPTEYLALAASYERIITDRLHFAICGLIARREVILLPNTYHKNVSMHATWLGKLGCRYVASLGEALRLSERAPTSWFLMSLATTLKWRNGIATRR